MISVPNADRGRSQKIQKFCGRMASYHNFHCKLPSQNFHHDGGRELEVGVPGSLPEGHLVGEAGHEVGDVGWVGVDCCG